jgi:hypothetical protein
MTVVAITAVIAKNSRSRCNATKMTTGRQVLFERALQCIARLMDGRPKRLEDFEDITPGEKQRRRDFASLQKLPNVITATRLEHKNGLNRTRTYIQMKGVAPTKVKRDHKICGKCLDTKAIDEFPTDIKSPDGHHQTCRECRNQQRRDWTAANRNRVNAKQRRNYKKRRDKQRRAEQGMTDGETTTTN